MPIPERLNPTFASSLPQAQVQSDPIEEARRRLIVALDVPSAADAIHLVNQLEPSCHWFKVGLELFVAAGPAVLEPLVARGHSIFLDLKFNDIPNTVAGAVRSAAALGVRMMTIHASGGPAMLAAAQAALEGMPDPPQLLAVTVLTSMDQAQTAAVGLERSPAEQVELLARMGLEAGIRGFVCSPQEVAALRAITGPEGVLVIPGIRPAGGDSGDQKRIATPGGGAAARRELPGRRPADHAGRGSPCGRRSDSRRDGRGSRRIGTGGKKPGSKPGFLYASNLKRYLKFLVEVAYRARNVDSAGDAALAVLDALDDARRLVALGTVSRLRRVHYLLAVTCFCNLCHLSGASPSRGCLCTHPPGRTASTARTYAASHRNLIAWKERDSLPSVYMTVASCGVSSTARRPPGTTIASRAPVLQLAARQAPKQVLPPALQRELRQAELQPVWLPEHRPGWHPAGIQVS